MKDFIRYCPGGFVLCVVMVGFLIFAMIASGIQAKKHEDFLKSHGCQQLTEAPTGRRIYCGKACFRDEMVHVYECADGTRTEVR